MNMKREEQHKSFCRGPGMPWELSWEGGWRAQRAAQLSQSVHRAQGSTCPGGSSRSLPARRIAQFQSLCFCYSAPVQKLRAAHQSGAFSLEGEAALKAQAQVKLGGSYFRNLGAV